MSNSYLDKTWTQVKRLALTTSSFKIIPQGNVDGDCGYWERFITTVQVTFYPWIASLVEPSPSTYDVWLQNTTYRWVVSDVEPNAANYDIWIKPL